MAIGTIYIRTGDIAGRLSHCLIIKCAGQSSMVEMESKSYEVWREVELQNVSKGHKCIFDST